MIEFSRYVFETLREDDEFVLNRGQGDGDRPPILLVAPVSKHPVPGILERLEHEYALRDELDSDWAARPLTLARRDGRAMLVLEDPGGEPLDRLLGQPMVIETHDLSCACSSCCRLVADLLLQGVHLEEVWCESQKALEFARKVKFEDLADFIVSHQRFILNMRGETTAFSSFSDARFDEDAFEAQLTGDRMPPMVCWYWLLKLQARFMSGDYDAAIGAARKAKALLLWAETNVQSVNYYYYGALTIATVHETAARERQAEGLETLKQSLDRLREWSESCPETFVDKYKLISAEIARIEGRDLDAMRLYVRF